MGQSKIQRCQICREVMVGYIPEVSNRKHAECYIRDLNDKLEKELLEPIKRVANKRSVY